MTEPTVHGLVDADREVALLLDIIAATSSGPDLEPMAAAVARMITAATASDVCFVHVLDDTDSSLTLAGATPPFDEQVDRIRIPLDSGVSGWVAAHREPVVIADDKESDPRYLPIAALRGKYVFGDINNGRVFAADLAALKKADDGIPNTMAPIEEVQLFERDASGNRVNVSFQELVNRKMGAKIARADLFISQTRDGELLITSRQDGTIRMLVADPVKPPER